MTARTAHRCPYVNPAHGGGRCGQSADHGGSHVLYADDGRGERIVTGSTPWVHPDVAPPTTPTAQEATA